MSAGTDSRQRLPSIEDDARDLAGGYRSCLILEIRSTDSSLSFFGNDTLFAVREAMTERWPWQTGRWTQTLDWPLNATVWHWNEH